MRIYFDAGGQGGRRFALDDILETRETDLSPMPDNFAELPPSDDLYHLLGFLLSQREKAARLTRPSICWAHGARLAGANRSTPALDPRGSRWPSWPP